MRNIARWIEMVGVFVGVPLILYQVNIPHVKNAVLLGIFIICLVLLLCDRTFYRNRFGLNGYSSWRKLLIRLVIIAGCLSLYTDVVEPENVLSILRHNSMRWVVTIITYPILSVVPQETIYRAFFFHRYSSLFKTKGIGVLANSLLFAFGHILFKNWVAIVGSFIASLLWATTYLGNRSLLIVTIEHAFYGNLAFTLGIGDHFYSPDF